ncbi:MAG: hypothetical protein HYV07_15825 [Deltaproteobacteria bacterium]|nr:hypothetical protein [Deltaproteobacteria bacterium]
MSGDRVGKALSDARLPGSPGGARIYKAEMQKAVDAAIAPEAGDAPGKPLTKTELSHFDGVQGAELSRAARSVLEAFRAKAPDLLAPDDAGGDAKVMGSASGNRKVYLNADGWPVPSADVAGMPALGLAEEGIYRLALVASAGSSNSVLATLSSSEKSALIENAIAIAKMSREAPNGLLPGLDANKTAQLRSSAATVLWTLATSLPASGATKQLSDRIHQALVKMADAEPHKWLGNHLARLMDRAEYRARLPSDQQLDVREIFESKFPKKFDVGNILDADGFISWEHVSGEGEGFFESFKANLLKQGIGGAKFKKLSDGYGGAEFELKFDPARGEAGRVKGIKLSVRRFSNDMFDAVGTKKGFSYGGHSNIGENQENSMENALLKGLKANGPQLALLDLCAGLDNLDEDLENLGNIEILTTFSSSLFWKGKVKNDDGHEFDGVTKSEGLESLFGLWDGLSKELDYEGCRELVSDRIYNWAHERNPNVVFPTLEDYREVRWAHLDGDDDGVMDAADALYQFGLKKASAVASAEYVLKDSGAPDELNGDAIKDAVLDLNVATHYNSVTSNSAMTHKFLAGGFFDGADSGELLRFAPGKNHDGSDVMTVSVNSRLAHTSREALEGLVQYMAIVDSADRGKLSGLNEVDRKLMGLVFATFRLNYDGQSRMNDQRIWTQLLDVLRLPSDMPYGPLANIVDAEHHDYSGNLEIVKKYKELLSESTKSALTTKAVGRPGAGPATAPAIA